MKSFSRLLSLLSLLLPSILLGQTGSITGRVTESGSREPIVGAMILVRTGPDTAIVQGSFTDATGHYVVRNLTPGDYRLTFRAIGYRSATGKAVSVTVGTPVNNVNIALEPTPVNLDAIIVSASRKPEKAIDAPASLSVIGTREITERVTLAPSDHLRTTAGVDIAQTGVVQQSVVSRGFNNVFSGSLTMLTDNRIAAVPSLRVNIASFIPLVNDDIDHIEVVRGPGSALYGPNATNGVFNIITRSPFASRGTSISLTGGERSLFQGTFRHADVIGEKVGFKISGQYFRGQDWEFVDSEEVLQRSQALKAGAREDTLRIGKREPVVERFGAEARVDFNLTNDLTAYLTAGLNQAVRTIELTDIGAAQAKDWRYTYYQGRITYGDLFVQAFLNQSDAGKTYLLRSGNVVVDRSRLFVAQVQHAYSFGESERLTYGADFLRTNPVTDGTITGRNEENDNISEYGGYLQSETRLFNNVVDVVLAGRVDKHSKIDDPIFSPRAAIVYKPWENQNFRVTFNRAYSTPTTNELFLDLLSAPNVFGFPEPFAVAVRASGVPTSGFTFNRDANGLPFFHSTFSPDRSAPIPVDAVALLWPAVVQILASQGVDISQIPPPGPADVGGVMAKLNTETGSFDPGGGPADVSQLQPTITQTFEFGYKGVVSEKMQASVDVYYSRIKNFVGQFQVFTPNVFLNGGDVERYLEPYVGSAQAAQLGAAIGGIPLGTVTPREAVDPTALLVAPRNFGKVSLAGIDLSVEYQFNEQFSCAGAYSFASKFFSDREGVEDLALNAPRNKGSLTLWYRGPRGGVDAEVRGRWREGFLMNSGVYVGTIASYALLDASIRYAIPGFNGTTVTLSALNLLDKRHREFIGAPEIGRLVMGRVTYAF